MQACRVNHGFQVRKELSNSFRRKSESAKDRNFCLQRGLSFSFGGRKGPRDTRGLDFDGKHDPQRLPCLDVRNSSGIGTAEESPAVGATQLTRDRMAAAQD